MYYTYYLINMYTSIKYYICYIRNFRTSSLGLRHHFPGACCCTTQLGKEALHQEGVVPSP